MRENAEMRESLGIIALFETHLTVTDLDASVAFYRDVLGLTLAGRFPTRNAAFFWIGGEGKHMLGLWSAPFPLGLHLHFGLSVSLDDLLAAPRRLYAAGIQTHDFFRKPCDAPSVFGWMPAASVYFDDPDGHSLELVSMLPGPPRPESGVVSWAEWNRPPIRSPG